jgi:hypothetical protein
MIKMNLRLLADLTLFAGTRNALEYLNLALLIPGFVDSCHIPGRSCESLSRLEEPKRRSNHSRSIDEAKRMILKLKAILDHAYEVTSMAIESSYRGPYYRKKR